MERDGWRELDDVTLGRYECAMSRGGWKEEVDG